MMDPGLNDSAEVHNCVGGGYCLGRRSRRWANINSAETMNAVIDRIRDLLTADGYSPKEVFEVRLALEEAIVNAVKHAHQGDLTKPVQVRYYVSKQAFVARVRDQGPGFDPQLVPDPREPENVERPTGRGLMLMRSTMTLVAHSRRGNCVTLCKVRSTDDGADRTEQETRQS
jgi:serine/threonine-protein kinase RsbW